MIRFLLFWALVALIAGLALLGSMTAGALVADAYATAEPVPEVVVGTEPGASYCFTREQLKELFAVYAELEIARREGTLVIP